MINRQDVEALEKKCLAPYAVKSGEGWGRQYREKEHPYRTRFQRDRDRVIHTSAFRRLEYKTQVFVYHEGDYYRTRLTHTMEVAQIARSICKSLQLNEDLSEAIALAHDLGHPPFGHTGQAVLNGLMKEFGGFEHNRQCLRIVRFLEKRYPEFDGLNLCWETLEGVSKRFRDADNPLLKIKGYKNPSLEAQVADFADGIAYNAHDLDDGLTSGLLELSQVKKLTLWREIEKKLDRSYSNLDLKIKKYQIVRNLINEQVTDFRKQTLKSIKKFGVSSVDDIRAASARVAGFSPKFNDKHKELKAFLNKNLYHHRRVLRMEFKAELFLTKIFNAYLSKPGLIPKLPASASRADSLERRICDYVSGMTDRYVIIEYKKLFSPDENDDASQAWE